MLLPASSSFVTGVIKERARASTLPPRLSFFRPAALVGGREEGEMEGGGGRSPTLRQSLQKRTLAQPECDETGECARPLRDRRYRQEGRQGEGYKDARERAGTTEPDSGLLLLPRLVASRGMVVGEKNSGARRRGPGRRRREGRPRWRCPSLRVCSFLCDEFSFGPVLSYGLERAHRKG